jgi:predicted PurR-regulated permease PerM
MSDRDGEKSVDMQPLLAGPIDIRSFVLTGIFALLLFHTLHFAAPILMPITVAMLFNLLLSPAVRMLNRLRIPQALAALLVLIVLLSLVAGAMALLTEPAREWLQRLPYSAFRMEQRLQELKEPIERLQQVTEQLEQAAQLGGDGNGDVNESSSVEIRSPGLIRLVLTGTPAVLATIGVVIVLLFFLLASGDALTRKIVSVMPRLTDKRRAVGIIRGIERDISFYLLNVTWINLTLGTVLSLALWLLGVPNPLLWGALIALLNYAPYIGALIGLIILAAVGLLSFDSLGQALLVPGVFAVMTVLEGQILTPLILGRRLALSPVAIFIAMLTWGWLWGIAGALIAVPLLASFKIVCENLEALRPIAVLLGDERWPATRSLSEQLPADAPPPDQESPDRDRS